MLTEMQVIDAVERYLNERGFVTREKVPSVKSRGHDLVMESQSGALLIVEAKGQGTTQLRTGRFGKEYSWSEREGQLGRAIVATMRSKSRGYDSGIALPGDSMDERLVQDRRSAFERLGLVVFMVDPERGDVRVELGSLPV
ncbi:MAG: hypothetical protein ACLQD8_00255 [Thermoplasmata archaeon]